MTEHRCWVKFEKDRALQLRIKKGEFGENLPIEFFPPSSKGYWPQILKDWCQSRGIEYFEEGLTISAKVKKEQIRDFIGFVYAEDSSYCDPAKMLTWKGIAYLANSLTNLRAFVEQQLNPRIWYELKADEF